MMLRNIILYAFATTILAAVPFTLWWSARSSTVPAETAALPLPTATSTSQTDGEESPDQPMRAIAPDDQNAVYGVGLLIHSSTSEGERERVIKKAETLFTISEREGGLERSIYIEGIKHPGRLYSVSTEPLPIASDGGLQLSEATSTAIMRARLLDLMRERGTDYGVIIQAGTSAETEFEKL